MPDDKTLNAVLGAYGLSGVMGQGGINWWNIIAAIVFGIIGWVAFSRGRKEKSWRPMVTGVALMVYPYFVSSTFLMFGIGIALIAALFFWKE